MLKHLVQESTGVSTVGDKAFEAVKKLVPLCCTSAAPDVEHSFDTILDPSSVVLEVSWAAQFAKSYPRHRLIGLKGQTKDF